MATCGAALEQRPSRVLFRFTVGGRGREVLVLRIHPQKIGGSLGPRAMENKELGRADGLEEHDGEPSETQHLDGACRGPWGRTQELVPPDSADGDLDGLAGVFGAVERATGVGDSYAVDDDAAAGEGLYDCEEVRLVTIDLHLCGVSQVAPLVEGDVHERPDPSGAVRLSAGDQSLGRDRGSICDNELDVSGAYTPVVVGDLERERVARLRHLHDGSFDPRRVGTEPVGRQHDVVDKQPHGEDGDDDQSQKQGRSHPAAAQHGSRDALLFGDEHVSDGAGSEVVPQGAARTECSPSAFGCKHVVGCTREIGTSERPE